MRPTTTLGKRRKQQFERHQHGTVTAHNRATGNLTGIIDIADINMGLKSLVVLAAQDAFTNIDFAGEGFKNRPILKPSANG
jgi:hypothetical protein